MLCDYPYECENMTDIHSMIAYIFQMDISLPLIAIIIAITIYFITKIFILKEYREVEKRTKREAMLSWLHENLIESIYIPLAEHAKVISEELLLQKVDRTDRTDRTEIMLYRISKFLHYVFKNRETFGSDMYFTPNGDDNRHLENISDRIISEMTTVYDREYDKNPTERRIVILEFLATCAKCRNYSEFKLLISGRPIFDRDLTVEINNLRDAYSDDYYLLFGYRDPAGVFLNPINGIINPKNLWQAWTTAKLYAYCSLFNKLFIYEIHKMYDSWYVEYPDTLKHHQLLDIIGWVNEIVKETDARLVGDYELRQKPYDKNNVLNDIGILNNILSDAKQKPSSAINSRMEIGSNKEISRIEVLRNIEVLYTISLQRHEMLESYTSEEFYKSITDLCYSFSWDDIPGDGSKRLLKYLINDHGISWAESAKIRKSDDGKTIHIFKNKKSVEIKINENKEKATLRIRYGITHDLKVEKKNDGIYIIDLRLLKNY